MSNSAVVEESRLEVLLEDMNHRLLAMEERMRGMEARLSGGMPAAPAPVATPAPTRQPAKEEGISEEILMVIAAAVAAFMGKRARIRKVRRMSESGVNPWSQQGRVSIQASHNVKQWTR